MRQASAYRTVRRRQSGTSVEIPVGTVRPSVLRGWGERFMRYPASEKLEIIELVEPIDLVGRPNPGIDWDSKIDVLRLVRPISGRGDRRLWRTATSVRQAYGRREFAVPKQRSWPVL